MNGNTLKVEWWAQDRMLRNSGDLITEDTRLKHAIQTGLMYDPRVHNKEEIRIRVVDGIAILNGIVGTMAEKYAAGQTALNTTGIWRVRKLINGHPTTSISDTELEQRVRQTLYRHPLVDRYDIQVSSQDGSITLEGYLSSPEEISQALRTASGVTGVTDVVNYLEFQSREQPDEEIWRSIRQSFWWDPRLYDRDISVIVRNGEATLEGTVPSLLEWRLAKQLVKEAGANLVRNDIAVMDISGTPSASLFRPKPSYALS